MTHLKDQGFIADSGFTICLAIEYDSLMHTRGLSGTSVVIMACGIPVGVGMGISVGVAAGKSVTAIWGGSIVGGEGWQRKNSPDVGGVLS